MEQQTLLTELLWLKEQLDTLYIHPSTPSSGMAIIAVRRRLDALVESVQSCTRDRELAIGYTDNAESVQEIHDEFRFVDSELKRDQ